MRACNWAGHRRPRPATEPAGHAAQDGGRRGTTQLRVVLADDDVLLRQGLAGLLERAEVSVAGDGSGLLQLARDTVPDLVVVDIRMPPTHTMEGLEAARVIRRELPDVGILVLSAHVEVEQALELLAGGRRVGYLLKSRVADVEEFLEAVRRIAKGGSSWIPPWFRNWSRRNDEGIRSTR